MNKVLLLVLSLFGMNLCFAQVLINSSNVGSYTTASEGDFYIDENGANYVGLTDGSLQILSNIKSISSSDGSVSITTDAENNINLSASAISSNWLLSGNSNITNGNYLGTSNDVKMEIRSNNVPILQFGRRQTLGLVQNYPGYQSNDQPLVYVNGNSSISALQFASSGASFYKPMFFTTTNGSFRLKGSSGGTDLFEIGSAGPANDGRLEFIIGDDGLEPIVFKRYDYRSGQFHTELFRVQGSSNSASAKPRFGININPAQVPVDADYDDASSSDNIANSTFQVEGSVSKSILTPSSSLGSLTLTEEHHTVVLSGDTDITLPTASTCKGRMYIIKNMSSSTINVSTFIDHKNASKTSLAKEKILWVQSDGSNWHQIMKL